jgi:hypothetical protein
MSEQFGSDLTPKVVHGDRNAAGGNAQYETLRAPRVRCPHRDEAQIQNRCDPYRPDLPRLFLPRSDAG